MNTLLELERLEKGNTDEYRKLIKVVQSQAKKLDKSHFMMATKAKHLTGDDSMDEYDLCIVSEETDEFYIGHWFYGFGFIGMLFPKETTRKLTKKEFEEYNDSNWAINSNPPNRLQIPLCDVNMAETS